MASAGVPDEAEALVKTDLARLGAMIAVRNGTGSARDRSSWLPISATSHWQSPVRRLPACKPRSTNRLRQLSADRTPLILVAAV